MSSRDFVAWFKSNFQARIAPKVAGTPFCADLLSAIAMQETGYIWGPRIHRLSESDLLRICVGDTIDAPGRSAFPRNKADLLSVRRGDEMFRIAREALEFVAQYDPVYAKVARNRAKFCHGFGLFQYDLQFFKTTPEFFLTKAWETFDTCLDQCLHELRAAMARQGWRDRTSLTSTEKIYLAIAYNRGRANLRVGFRQGHCSEGRYYGENIFEFFRLAQTVADCAPGVLAVVPAVVPDPGQAPLPQPTEVTALGGDVYQVDPKIRTSLRLRAAPEIAEGNIVARLPAGTLVHKLGGKRSDAFLEVETSLRGAYFRGFAANAYLLPLTSETQIPVLRPETADPFPGVIAANLPAGSRAVKRCDPANALSLHEPGAPSRCGATADERCRELAAIIDWLAVDDPSHRRYQPARGCTFCNIYAHDYGTLAGVYLPRVWWNGVALARLARGEALEPQYGRTVDEVRANDLFRWLRDFGPGFGWRQTGTLTKLQDAANLGGVGLIVACRKDDGRSGHIVAVVPETDAHRARRDAAGNVTAALQSQAGTTNYRYGTPAKPWWRGDQFADSAFWIHA